MNKNIPKTLANYTSTQFHIGQKKVIEIMLCLTTLLGSPLATSEELSETQGISSNSGMINRAPLVSSKFQPSNLDRISTDISNITESLSNILAFPIEEEEVITEIDNTEEPAQQVQPLVTKPEKDTPKKIEVAKPAVIEIKPLAAKQKQAVTPGPLQLEPIVNTSIKQPEITAKEDIGKTENTIKIKYLKKGLNGKALPDDAPTWSCVEDINNGLIWEVKSDDDSIRDKNNSYTWFQPDAAEAPQGVADGGQCKGGSDCDTHAYVELTNKQNYCGYSNWRLPTKDEMLTIVNFENNASTVTINNNYFPDALPSWYWTASTNENKPEYAWYVLFSNGITLNSLKEHPKHIRLVRTQAMEG